MKQKATNQNNLDKLIPSETKKKKNRNYAVPRLQITAGIEI